MKRLFELVVHEVDGGEALAVIETKDFEIRENADTPIDAAKKAIKELGRKALNLGLRKCLGQLELDLDPEPDDEKDSDNVRSLDKSKKGRTDA